MSIAQISTKGYTDASFLVAAWVHVGIKELATAGAMPTWVASDDTHGHGIIWAWTDYKGLVYDHDLTVTGVQVCVHGICHHQR